MKPNIQITQIAEALDFGHGSISGQDEPEVLAVVDATIYSPDVLIKIDKDDDGRQIDDDGCGDGRAVKAVYTHDKLFKRSLNRAKVFGGAVAMTAANLVGLGRGRGKNLNEVFTAAIDDLVTHDINFGAHTAEDAHNDDENSGCGAIDKAPDGVFAALEYETPIRQTIDRLGVEADGLDEVYGNYREYVVKDLAEKPEYSGRKVVNQVLSEGKVVKELGDLHKERRIVLNMVRGYTVNQRLVRERTNDKAQVFAVDVWRLEDIARDLHLGEPELQRQAFLSQLIYTLAVAAVLTKGDLPVYMVQEEPAPVTV